ncbi:MAG: putative RND superfamily exporter protein, partial [Bacteroidia bacterium]
MWQKIGSKILRFRVTILIIIGLITVFMGYRASKVEIRYDFAMLLPPTDSTSIAFNEFKERFGHDGKVLVIGIQDDELFQLERFQLWYDLGEELLKHPGTTELVSTARCADLIKNDSLQRFEIKPLVPERPTTQAQVDSIHARLLELPFYHDYLITEDHSTIMAVTISEDVVDSKERNAVVAELLEIGNKYEDKLNKPLHFSGLPFIRSTISAMVSKELGMFLGLAGLISFLIMLIFFRSFKVVFFSIIVVAIGVIWAFGIIGLLGYKLSILTGLMPPVLIVIGIANCIFLLNKYHSEYKRHKKKALALTRMVKNVGQAILFTNATTASGFATFALLDSELMHEFGMVASLCIMAMFAMCLLLIPIIFSYVGAPRERHVKHLDSKFSEVFISRVIQLVLSHRTKVYWVFGFLLLIAAFGISQIKVTGNLVDDLPDSHRVVKDLRFFESNFGGVMPFEVQIDALKPKKATSVR